MSSTTSEGEILPPIGPPVPVPDYAPAHSGPRERSSWNPMASPATYALVALNIAVFLWMVAHNAYSDTSPDALFRYGATGRDHILLQGQWWRLLTATFVHGGFLHIALNMWCLWNLGLLGEPLVGPWGLGAIYCITGIAGNLLSLAINVLFFGGGYNVFQDASNNLFRVDIPAVGASGAVFGIAGILIVLLSNRKLPIPWPELKRLRRSVIQFAILNLVLGGASFVLHTAIQIDNFAHVGGFLSGLALGVPLVPRMTSGRQRYLERQKIVFVAAAFLLALFAYFIYRAKPV